MAYRKNKNWVLLTSGITKRSTAIKEVQRLKKRYPKNLGGYPMRFRYQKDKDTFSTWFR